MTQRLMTVTLIHAEPTNLINDYCSNNWLFVIESTFNKSHTLSVTRRVCQCHQGAEALILVLINYTVGQK